MSGKLILARDAAHARWKALLDRGEELPSYATRYAIMYAGPAKKPKHACSGSLGPTTAGRLDSYADDLLSRGAALVTIAKGIRSAAWTDACRKYGSVTSASPRSRRAIADQYITSSEVLDYDDLAWRQYVSLRLKTSRFSCNHRSRRGLYRILGRNTHDDRNTAEALARLDDDREIREPSKPFAGQSGRYEQPPDSVGPDMVKLYHAQNKKAALTLGAERLSNCAEILEKAARKEEAADYPALFRDMEAEYTTAAEELASFNRSR